MESDTRDLERDLHSEGYNVLDNDVYKLELLCIILCIQSVTLPPHI